MPAPVAGDAVSVVLNGRTIEGRFGESVAALLVREGVRVFRRTPSGEPRGLFCGMGACQDCLVTLDGVPGRRACLASVRPGQVVVTGDSVSGGAAVRPAVWTRRRLACDLLVIGGGPAGLAGAAAAAEAGLDVVVLDERSKLGGQYYKQPFQAGVDRRQPDRQADAGRRLIERVEQAGARILSETALWSALDPDQVEAVGPEISWTVTPRRLLVATGAYERVPPLPGWTLPGFMTVGAAQTLLRAYGALPGRRILLAGNGPLTFQVAAELVRAGATVAAVVELARPRGLSAAAALARMAAATPGLVRDGLGYVLALRRAAVPILFGHALTSVEGEQTVKTAVVAEFDRSGRPLAGSERRFEVDTVCAGYGFQPANEATRALGCRHRYDPVRGHLVVERDRDGRTSRPGVWSAGDAGALAGAQSAQASGLLAGCDIVRDLGRMLPVSLVREADVARTRLAAAARFQAALWRLYAAPSLGQALAAPDTVICRCEGVTLASLTSASSSDVRAAGSLKRATRAGMGRCQGRYCAATLAAIGAGPAAEALEEMSFFAPRTPFKPVPVGAVAAPADQP